MKRESSQGNLPTGILIPKDEPENLFVYTHFVSCNAPAVFFYRNGRGTACRCDAHPFFEIESDWNQIDESSFVVHRVMTS